MSVATLVLHEDGDPSDPVLLLLHGVTDAGPAWADAIERWLPEHHVVAPDLLGHGDSPRLTPEQLADPDPMEHVYASLEAAVERLGSPVQVVGHSMGGGLAAALAARRPDLVRAAVLEDPAWYDAAPFGDARARARERVAEAQAAQDDLEAEIERGRREHPSWPASELRPWAQASADLDPAFGEIAKVSLQVPWREIAAALTVPTLLVTGTGTVVVGPQTRAAIAALGNPRLELAVIAGAGHCVRREQTAAFHAVVDPWLASHR